MSNVKKLPTKDYNADAFATVEKALDQVYEFDAVSAIVFIYGKDGVVRIVKSPIPNTMELIGALEMAKMQIWKD